MAFLASLFIAQKLHLGCCSRRDESRDIKVRTGQFLQGVVRRIDKTRKTKDLKGISIDLLIPGMLVNTSVRSILENGVMLSFLTYFTGTVDMFHLQNQFPTKDWKDDYNQNKKINARILFIDPSTRAVGLTLNPHLVHNKAPPSHVNIGEIYDQSKVIRVDRGLGLLLDIPSKPVSTPAYVYISDVAEEEVRKLEKKFKEGSQVRVRIHGFRHLEGLATGILKASAFEGQVFTHSDVKPGMVIRAKVIALDSFSAIVQFPGGVKALCPIRHMSEFEIAKPGKKFKVGAELVFRVLGCKSKRITVTHKKTLVKSKLGIISSYADATEGFITHGWITKIEKHGCFVRVTSSNPASRRINLSFQMKPVRVSEDDLVKLGSIVSGLIDRLTPSAVVIQVNSKAHLKGTISNEHLADNHESAALLKSVLKPGYKFDQLLVLDIEGNNILLSAKYSLTSLAEQLPSDISQIHPNSVVHGYVCNLIETGCFVRFLGRLTGFSPRSKSTDDYKADLSGAFYVGQSVRSNILDIAKLQSSDSDGSELKWVEGFNVGSVIEGKIGEAKDIGVKRKREASKDLEVHQTVNAVVEIVKEHYLVLAIPEYNYAIGYASKADYNTQKFPQKQFVNGQSEVTETSSSKRAKKKSSYSVGSLVSAEVNDDNVLENPFANFKIGQTITARVVGKANQKGYLWDLSIKPTMLAGTGETGVNSTNDECNFSAGQLVTGYVYKMDTEWAWLTISRHVKAQLYILDSAREPNELQQFQERFKVGKAVSGHVLNVNKDKKLLRLVRHPLGALSIRNVHGEDKRTGESDNNISGESVTTHIHEGDILGGRISKILPGVGGLLVQIGPHIFGRVHFTELKDTWESDPLSGYYEGQFVKCKVLEISHSVKGTIHIDLSLRLSLDGMLPNNPSELGSDEDSTSKRVEKIEDLYPNMAIQECLMPNSYKKNNHGYVKNTIPKGCFILLSRKLDAKILLSNLSDGYIDDPKKEFPIGKLVAGSLHVGDIVSGRIRRVESYGLFVTLDHTNMVGLCHVSELSDDHVDNIQTKYRAGEKVTAKILKLDEERHRISLGMKNSYLTDDIDIQIPSNEESDEDVEETDDTRSRMLTDSTLGMAIEYENGASSILAQAESRASIPPLEVTLDDIEHSDMDILVSQNQANSNEAVTGDEKNKRRAKKKAKEDREREIRAAEERQLEMDVPRTADEFEKLVRNSPNSSFVWIKYMAFMLNSADIEKARAIAERALRTINIREENEKLNIWVAYFNLENQYGNPPEEAVQKIFQRALQYCDPKKVWLRRVQQQQDGVQSVVNRALLCLPRHKHIKFISQTAILEFKSGVPDRGRSMFEGILREYPKRTDLWSIYLDQEIRLGDEDVIRALFERAISLSLPPKKMKFLFKKYLDYEKSLGDEERIKSVKQKAMDYVESTLT
ncbi:S1 domain - like 5 [Theobroma cacao]|nr:S1 domain - like 5 [Theobroma cacao]